jgi:Tol biopolymer transport system component
MAQPFDAGKMKFSGEPLPVAEPVTVNPTIRHAGFSISQNGVLAYNRAGDRQNVQLTWYDRSGRVIRTIGQPGMIRTATISPDGATVAYDRRDPQTGSWDVWLRDLARGTDSRFTLDSALNPERGPVWSPDSSHVAFLSIRDGKSKLYQKATSSVTEDELLDEGSPQKRVDDWSRDGRYIVLETTPAPKTGTDLWVLPLFGDRKPYPYIHTEFNEGNARLSPKGQWLVYVSNRSKRSEIYVESFPTRGVQWQVSTNGGTEPVWSLDGKELYFIGPDQKLMAVEVKTAGKFEAGAPKPLFATRLPSRGRFDVSRDGLFLIPTAIEESASVPIHVIVNWHAGLKR